MKTDDSLIREIENEDLKWSTNLIGHPDWIVHMVIRPAPGLSDEPVCVWRSITQNKCKGTSG